MAVVVVFVVFSYYICHSRPEFIYLSDRNFKLSFAVYANQGPWLSPQVSGIAKKRHLGWIAQLLGLLTPVTSPSAIYNIFIVPRDPAAPRTFHTDVVKVCFANGAL
jgi:hypothetical protein